MSGTGTHGILLVGCGKMGAALAQGWLAAGRPARSLVVVEPEAPALARANLPKAVRTLPAPEALDAAFRPAVVVLAVKPQAMEATLPAYRRFAGAALFLSIAAGKTIAGFERALGPEAAIVRAMPNTPAAIGRGISALAANERATPAQRTLAEQLLGAVGETLWLAAEGDMDAVTAVSGSGPAYVFHLVEALAAAGRAAGLEDGLAMRLARATVSGSGALLAAASESAEQLRKNVTSPNGTTQAALDVLMGPEGLAPLLRRAVAAAQRRSRELAS
jgi:pyrroline-5-carboxylate reductase